MKGNKKERKAKKEDGCDSKRDPLVSKRQEANLNIRSAQLNFYEVNILSSM